MSEKPSLNRVNGSKMFEHTDRISPLKRIRLSLEAGTVPETMDLTDGPLTFEFIIGIGKQGLSPFEIQLMGNRAGDELRHHLTGSDLPVFLEHLLPAFPFHPKSDAPFHIKLQILEIATPDNREVVRAMAEGTGCGGSCCGNH